MKSKRQNFFYSAGRTFISTRTHFNFIKRLFTWLSRYSSSFADLFTSFAKKLPFVGPSLLLLGYLLDILAFGTNPNNSKFTQLMAGVGFGCMMILSSLALIYSNFIGATLIASLGIMVSMYFEAVTILNWFDNFKNLEWQKLNGEPTLDVDHNNANTMFYAATITFSSMVIKAIALCLSATFPGAALALIIVGQTAEVAAMIGTLGKEKVNLSQNFKSAPQKTTKTASPVNSALNTSRPKEALSKDENEDKKILSQPSRNQVTSDHLKSRRHNFFQPAIDEGMITGKNSDNSPSALQSEAVNTHLTLGF